MKLLYTDIRTSLTEILTREAEELVAAGKRVFYIASFYMMKIQLDNLR